MIKHLNSTIRSIEKLYHMVGNHDFKYGGKFQKVLKGFQWRFILSRTDLINRFLGVVRLSQQPLKYIFSTTVLKK
jgi:UDP-2,3-diacylglucosamine pyrophosphatase LpxH